MREGGGGQEGSVVSRRMRKGDCEEERWLQRNHWRKYERKHDSQEGDRGESDSRERGWESGTGKDRSKCGRRKCEGKKGSASGCDRREVHSGDDDRKK